MSAARLSVIALAGLTGCSVLVQPDLSRGRGDGGSSTQDVSRPPDSANLPDVIAPPDDVISTPDVVPTCPNDCNDNITCTIDRCNAGTCVNTPDNTACGPDSRCDLAMGCVPNMMTGCNGPADCNDSNPCTVDACNARVCSNTPVDRDMDGAPAAMVDGRACGFANADCNDNDRAINPRAAEVCDRVDNNCNGMTDEVPMCGVTMNTTCANAQRVDLTSATSTELAGNNAGVASTVQSYCGTRMELGAGGERWYSVTWPQNRDLWIEATRTTDGLDPVLWVGDACGRMPIACNDDIANSNNGSRVVLRADGLLGTRTALVAVDSFNTTGGGFTLRFRTQSSGGRDCNNAMQIDGGTIRAPTSVASLSATTCGGMGVGNVENYRYRGASGQVRVFASSGSILARRDCGSMGGCFANGATFMSSGDSIVALERSMSPYTLTILGP